MGMKTGLKILLACFALTACTEDSQNSESYIQFALEGPTWSGDIKLMEDDDPAIINVTGLIYPPDQTRTQETSIITFQDMEQGIAVTLFAPAKKGLAVMREEIAGDFPWSLSMIRNSDGVVLASQEVSLNISEFETGSGSFLQGKSIKKAIGNFDGVMIYRTGQYGDEGAEITEAHTISGDFKAFLR